MCTQGVLNRSKAAPVGRAVFIAICVIVKSLSLLPKKDLLIYFFSCFLKILSLLGCLGTRWNEGVMCGSHSFFVTSQIERGPPNVCVQCTRSGCMSPLASPIPISTKSSCMVLPTSSAVVEMEPVGIAWEPKELSSWKMGQIHLVVWPNNFLSCQFIEKWLGRENKMKMLILLLLTLLVEL